MQCAEFLRGPVARYIRGASLGFLGFAGVAAGAKAAELKVDKQPVGPDGDTIGCSVSPRGSHVAVLATKGSRFEVLIDGVEGPKIDELLSNITGGPVSGSNWVGKIPVLFSPDGAHSAYVAKLGDEYVVCYDGKELTRGPIKSSGQITVGLSFSNNGKHLYYMDKDDGGKYRIVVDGKPGPGSQSPPQLVLSPDGDHYAYVGYPHNGGGPPWAVVDGHQVNYFGDNLQYTGKNVLVSIYNEAGANTLVLDGKPEIKACQLTPMWISPDGAQLAIVITPKSGDKSILSINGKPIPGTEGVIVTQVYFSPDGKRWAALCNTKANSKYMLIDGKKGAEYQDISGTSSTNAGQHRAFVTGNVDFINYPRSLPDSSLPPTVPGFTADSSKFVYLSSQGGRSFLVVDDEESGGFQSGMSDPPTLSASGNRIGWIGIARDQKQHLLVDGKDTDLGPASVPGTSMRASALSFSPSSAHYVFLYGQGLDLDSVVQPGVANGYQYVFSPDEKHFAYTATVAGHGCVVLDGRVVTSDVPMINCAFFSPDSQHLFWVRTMQIPGSKDGQMLYVDGKPATHYGENAAQPLSPYEFSPDGALTFVSRTDFNLRRFRVTPSADTDVTTMLAEADAAAAKAKADGSAEKTPLKR